MKRVAIVLALLLAACGGDDDSPAASTTTVSEQTPSATEATTSTSAVAYSRTPVSTPEGSTEQGTLTKLDVGKHDGFTRVVFTFSEAKAPAYAVQYADPPFTQDGSGDEVEVGGSDFITVRLIARAHDDEGKPTVKTGRVTGPSGGTVTEVVPTGDFEGVVGYVIGTNDTKGMRVYALTSPARLVVDIAAAT